MVEAVGWTLVHPSLGMTKSERQIPKNEGSTAAVSHAPPTPDVAPPIRKRRRPFIFWVAVPSVVFAVLYPISFGPACWLDSLRQPEANAVAMSWPLNVLYAPIAHTVTQLDNNDSDDILRFGSFFAAGGRRLELRVLARPGERRGKVWFVWFGKGAAMTKSGIAVAPDLNQDDMPESY